MKRAPSPEPAAPAKRAAPAPSMLASRVRPLAARTPAKAGRVVYWMSRDQRVRDNWALTYAQQLAAKHGAPLAVVFCLAPSFLGATYRHFAFMVKGLRDVEKGLKDLSVPFYLLHGDCTKEVPAFAAEHSVTHLITDFSPLRIGREWREAVAGACKDAAVFEVDAHNVVPVWVASDKQEVGARTIRKKIEEKAGKYLEAFPAPEVQSVPWPAPCPPVDWAAELAMVAKCTDGSVGEVDWITPGEFAARDFVDAFLTKRLRGYSDDRNDPTKAALSNLSPYLHYGHTCTATVALRARELKVHGSADFKAFFEESVVRKELADNFCFYNKHYDRFEGFAGWAQETLKAHAKDPREHVYTQEQWERAETHDPLWNAAQVEMVKSGKMHGFMRMYWAKKILEWSATPQEALRIAIYLNDRYELDGRDPNGYVGCAWSVGGVHDMGWPERPVFGKIRYMNFAGCQRKFDVAKYIAKWKPTTQDLRAMIKKKPKAT